MSSSPRPVNLGQQQARQASVQEVISLAHAGAFARARSTAIELLRHQASNPDAWFWLACVTENAWEAVTSLQKVQELVPKYPADIENGLRWLHAQIAAGQRIDPLSAPFVPRERSRARGATVEPVAPADLRKRWLVALSFVVLILLLGGGAIWFPELSRGKPDAAAFADVQMEEIDATPDPQAVSGESWSDAWERADWSAAIVELSRLSAADSANSQWRRRLSEAHAALGKQLLQEGLAGSALTEFDAALSLDPYNSSLHQRRGQVSLYLAGVERYEAGDWSKAIGILSRIPEMEGSYLQMQPYLYGAHYSLGMELQEAGELDQAEAAYQTATQYASDIREIEKRLLEIELLRIPPTPVPAAKRIEVSIASQRFLAYEDDRLVYDFVCSTGMYSSPTQRGSYEILDKIPMAYGSTWDLDMPHWMGIYWSGNLENGIHALPILSNGQLLWEGYLGQPASYGCVILTTEDAETIYNWAEVGTPVVIY